MKIKEKLKASGKKLLAGVMAAATAITALPLQSLAAEIKPIAEPAINPMSLSTGSTGYTLYGKDYNPSDGNAWGGSSVCKFLYPAVKSVEIVRQICYNY